MASISKAEFAAELRRVADLIEGNDALPNPYSATIHFFDYKGNAQAIAQAFPGGKLDTSYRTPEYKTLNVPVTVFAYVDPETLVKKTTVTETTTYEIPQAEQAA